MIVSNSEIETFQRCEMRYYFQFILGVRPKEFPQALETGIFGHRLFERYWTLWLQGKSQQEITKEVSGMILEVQHKPHLGRILRNVFAFAQHMVEEMHLEPVEVETVHKYRMLEHLEFGMTPDLIARFSRGIYKDQHAVVDYKFTGQYWSEQEIEMYQQIPKYIRFLNSFEYQEQKIKRGLLVLLNSRAAAASNDLFRTKWLHPNKEKLQRIAVENFDLSFEIMERKTIEMKYQYDVARRTLNHYECKLCPYANDVCPMSLSGHDITKTLAVNYVETDYGYEDHKVDAKL